MKAKFKLGDAIASIPSKYLDQQTCCDSVFDHVPAEMVDFVSLISANKENRYIRWYWQGSEHESLHITIPTDLIEWED